LKPELTLGGGEETVGRCRIIHGDCVEVMAAMDAASVDSVVCDPPYGLEFMGKEWDSFGRNAPPSFEHSMQGDWKGFRPLPRPGGLAPEGLRAFQEWSHRWAVEAYRVLKPGGHLFAFGGTRTYHRLACGLEDAGFEIRDMIAWLYGSGFPKSLDVAKAIDKSLGAEGSWRQEDHPGRPGARTRVPEDAPGARVGQAFHASPDNPEGLRHVYEPVTEEAKRWEGWGTALKPAFEPVVVARKPLVGTVAGNVLEHGTGALNIDACRIDYAGDGDREAAFPGGATTSHGAGHLAGPGDAQEVVRGGFEAERPEGRWPANVVLDEEAATLLDEQSGERKAGGKVAGTEPSRTGDNGIYGEWGRVENRPYADTGGASRFFYCAKVSRAERNAGLEGFAKKPILWSSGEQNPGSFQSENVKAQYADRCRCETTSEWANEDLEAAHPEATDSSPQRATDESGIPSSSDSEWSTSSSGRQSTALSPPDSRSTTGTETSSTTDSKTSNSSPTSTTNESTRPTTGEPPTEPGNGDARSVGSGSPQPASTSTSPEKDGSVTDDAAPVTSGRSSSESGRCAKCGGVIGVGVRNPHPT
jgi:site-specific DNA-methyltransferase (adenine-specific)